MTGLLSTRKAIASLRTNPNINAALEKLTGICESIPEEEFSNPTNNEELMQNPPPKIICSDCVQGTAQQLIFERNQQESNEFKHLLQINLRKSESCDISRLEASILRFREVTEEEFLLKLVEVGTGPFIKQWKKAGVGQAQVLSHLQSAEAQHKAPEIVEPPPGPSMSEPKIILEVSAAS
jgi:hypothetical protein